MFQQQSRQLRCHSRIRQRRRHRECSVPVLVAGINGTPLHAVDTCARSIAIPLGNRGKSCELAGEPVFVLYAWPDWIFAILRRFVRPWPSVGSVPDLIARRLPRRAPWSEDVADWPRRPLRGGNGFAFAVQPFLRWKRRVHVEPHLHLLNFSRGHGRMQRQNADRSGGGDRWHLIVASLMRFQAPSAAGPIPAWVELGEKLCVRWLLSTRPVSIPGEGWPEAGTHSEGVPGFDCGMLM